MEDKRRKEMKDVVAHFNGRTPTAKELQQYCTRMGYEYVSVGEFDDAQFQVEHDKLAAQVVPKILALLQEMKFASLYDSDAKQKEASDHNTRLETRIAEVLEEHGLRYGDVDSLMGQLSQWTHNLLENAKSRAEKMGMEAAQKLAERTFDKDMFGKIELRDLSGFLKEMNDADKSNDENAATEAQNETENGA